MAETGNGEPRVDKLCAQELSQVNVPDIGCLCGCIGILERLSFLEVHLPLIHLSPSSPGFAKRLL